MSNKEINFTEVHAFLKKFEGGEVTLDNTYFDKGLAIITINNPTKRNAMSGKMMIEFRECVQKLQNWQNGKAVLLCGKGVNFCSGGDLSFARQCGIDEGIFMSCWMQDALTMLQNLPLFSVCLVNGPTLGGGTEISLACDFLLATDDVKYGCVQGKMGVSTAWGGATRLIQKIGPKKAFNLFLTGQIMTADELLKLGIADAKVSSANGFQEALEWIEQRLKFHHTVTRSFKLAVTKATTSDYHTSLAFERDLFSKLLGAEPNREALAKGIKHIPKDSKI